MRRVAACSSGISCSARSDSSRDCRCGKCDRGIRSAGLVQYRRGDAAQPEFHFLIVHHPALRTRSAQCRLQDGGVGDGMRRETRQFPAGEECVQFTVRKIGQQQFAHGAGMRRRVLAKEGFGAYQLRPIHRLHADHPAVVQDSDMHRLAGLLCQFLQRRQGLPAKLSDASPPRHPACGNAGQASIARWTDPSAGNRTSSSVCRMRKSVGLLCCSAFASSARLQLDWRVKQSITSSPLLSDPSR